MIFDSRYPSVEDLRLKAKKKIPKFAFEYLDGGCYDDTNLDVNISDLKKIKLIPEYINNISTSNIKTNIFGIEYDAPFGIAPVGLQGLMWPKSPEILAKAAYNHNIPFILSTVSTSTIETIASITEGKAWYQLYYPVDDNITFDILNRLKNNQYQVLVVLADVPTFGYRPRDIKNGLAMPPKMSIKNILQIFSKPEWAVRTLINGAPTCKNLEKYTDSKNNMAQFAEFMNKTFDGRLNIEKLKKIRDLWPGKLVLKGVDNLSDIEKAVSIGFDGVIVSNHGGRQLDAARSSIESLKSISPVYKDKINIFMDSGIRTGTDIARAIACGADMAFLGRAPMYSVCALGNKGGEHVIKILKVQLTQVIEQLGCAELKDLRKKVLG